MLQINMFDIMYPNFKFDSNKEIIVLETFAGIGSQRKALDRLSKKMNLNIKYLPPVEFDKYAISSYNAIHGTNHETKDITKTYGNKYGEIDLFTYSFPCQDISLAGNQKGFSRDSKTRSGLLWEVERILKEMKYKPKVLLMENVKNLISEQFMPDFQEWIRELEKLGYSNYYQVLNAKDYGIPQNRERVFMVSILGEYNYKFPQIIPLKLRLKDMLEDEVDEKYYLSDKMLKFFNENTIKMQEKGNGFKFSPIEKEKAEVSKTITTHNGSRMDDNFILQPYTIAYPPTSREFNQGFKDISPTLCARDYKDPKVVLIPEATTKGYAEANDGDGVYINRPHQKRGVVQKGMIQTLKTSGSDVGVVIVGNYMPSRHNASRIVDNEGIANKQYCISKTYNLKH